MIYGKVAALIYRHRANQRFWRSYYRLPKAIQRLAKENYKLLKQDPYHPSLHFKKVGRFWSARVNIEYRAVAIEEGQDIVWFWIGHHEEYGKLIRG